MSVYGLVLGLQALRSVAVGFDCPRISGVSRRAESRRGPMPDDLGTPSEWGVEHCHGGLPGLRWGGPDHCQPRGNRGGRGNPHPTRRETRRARSCPAAAVPGAAPDGAVRLSGPPTNTARGCDAEGRLRWRLTAGAVCMSATADGWLGGLGRWNADQSHSAGQIDDPAVARTSARRCFRLTRRGSMPLIPNCTKSGLVRSRTAKHRCLQTCTLPATYPLFGGPAGYSRVPVRD